MRVRLAPSPTGTLHIGTARTALYNWLFASRKKGQFLLRIEDTDKERSKTEYTTNILEGLEWLGIEWEGSPIIQSERIQEHRDAIQSLLDTGAAYRCYATDAEIEAMREDQRNQGKAPRYDNRHRNLSPDQESKFISEGREAVIRFKIEDETFITWDDLVRGQMRWNASDLGGDMVIARRASAMEIGAPLYNLVVVVDDAAMEITHVIRGEDHLANTAKQLLLYKALGLNTPQFAHTPLILNQEGRKLSKRDGVTSISQFKEMGYTAEAMANYMTLLGWSAPEGMTERFTIQEASSVFNFDRVNKAGAKFDWDKLNWLNSQVIHSWSPDVLLDALKPLLTQEGWLLPEHEWCISLMELIGPSLTLLTDGVKQSRPFFEKPVLEKDAINQLEKEGAKQALKCLLDHLNQDPWDGIQLDQAKELLAKSAKSANVKKGLIMKSLRAGLLGCMQGPDLMSSWSLLARIGKDSERLTSCI
ncbi:glutamate--tRNA ligase [Prochlorococcus sp. MIT 1307]|uniref:glutamate--tRNA ligase n=1 Tax=Prochlorococcus sp. MIT 1307 TaxID=3096219 RepID=UPI002A761565|nr:glutamate--tRNA ligase [Prochlorococcus sp. MIT 1307]